MKFAHGTFCWNELVTRDVATAEKFYTELLGWQAAKSGMPGMDYTLFKAHEKDVAGLMQMLPTCQRRFRLIGWATLR